MAALRVMLLRLHLPQVTRARLAALHFIHLGIVGKSHLQPMKRAPYAGHQHFVCYLRSGDCIRMGRLWLWFFRLTCWL